MLQLARTLGLDDRAQDQAVAAGLSTERRAFHPHVTLARHCVRGLPGARIAPVGWRVESIALMASETLPGGPRYRALGSWPLAGAAPLP